MRETGRDPAWLIGAPVPQLGSNAGRGEGWLVVEGDESDRSVFGLPAEIAVSRTSSSTTTPSSRSLAELEAAFERWDGEADQRRRATRRRSRARWPFRASTTGGTRAAALAALELAGVARGRGRGRARALHGHGPALRGLRGRRRDDRRRLRLITRPSSPRRSRRCARRIRAGGCACCSSRTSTRARGTSADELGAALAAADEAVVTEIYPAREQPIPGVSGKLVVDALSDRGRVPGVDSHGGAGRGLPRGAGPPGDVLLVIGAGDVDAAPALLRAELGGAAVAV